MEVLFENTYLRDQKNMKEILAYALLRRPIMIVLDIFMALSLLLLIVESLYYHYFNVKIPLLFGLYLLFRIFPFFNSVRMSLKRDAESCSEVPVRVISTVTEDVILLSDGHGSTAQLPLSAVKYAAQTNHFLLLRTNAKLIYSFHKEGFTKGSYGEFLHFLHYKGIPIK